MLGSQDLALVAALLHGRSIRRAAELMGVHASTVFRKLERLEADLGVRLFERLRDGYVATAAGEELGAIARRTEDDLLQAESRLRGQDMRLSGLLRVTTTDTLLATVLPAVLAAFRVEHPHVALEVSVSNQPYDLIRRDADVAVRPTAEPPQNLVGRRIGAIGIAVYASRKFLADRGGRIEDPSAVPWIGPDNSLSHIPLAQWQDRLLRGNPSAIRVNSLLGAFHAARAGLGLTTIPCYLGDYDSELVRVGGLVRELTSSLWLLTHPDLRRVARVMAFMDFVGTSLQDRLGLLAGEAPRPKRPRSRPA